MSAENGMSLDVLAETAHNVYNILAGSHPVTWGQVPVQIQDVWGPIAAKAVVLIEAADGLKFKELAGELYRIWASGMAQKDKPFDSLPVRERLMWEAISRHLTNLIDSDGASITASEHEQGWKDWLDNKHANVSGKLY
jgi:hypothetical protein